ncbi:head decoration protein [Cytobacillus sp. IB215665]|uniref:head decoration protein n=1 Tax=Cytobacillus sp. IB215665 TaxID=3097357 RepID=UPI002A174CBD|nr:head decoration protein [Cytobacillus sp. IB215665]MDX8367775.1 head decoration protein [Cytobacillus sp. IB215665]
MPEQLVTDIGSRDFDNLIAGGQENITTGVVTLKGGNQYTRGTVVGLLTADGSSVIVDSSKSDGSERPYGILTDDVDTTDGDMEAVVYLTGEFNEDKLTFGGADTPGNHRQSLREMGIFIKKIG